ncbi:MAG TPA: hypothetical protein VFE01_04010 [Terracidiphilus sp.]|jgi:hypothetical protein|nr:hypothetical protein [Terracidiphilus sp.]
MRYPLILFLLATLLVPICANAQNARSTLKTNQNASKFIGVWRGQFDSLPGIDLVIADEGSALHGAILFYLHKRPDTNTSYTSTPGLPEPLLNIHLDGQTLHFQVSHRRAHPPRTLHDQPVTFHLKLTGSDQAELVNDSEGAPMLTMKRSDF